LLGDLKAGPRPALLVTPPQRLEDKLLPICDELAPSAFALCAYGSHVCGYARPDSDLDVLAVCEEYPTGVRYLHSKGDPSVSLLAVDRELFEIDAEKGALGEFVSGRILGPYEPLKAPGYFRKVEHNLKLRVIEEEAKDLVMDYGEMARGLVIELDYFPLARMRRQARVYPPLRYSYLHLFSPALKARNMARILPGYRAAAGALEEKAIIRLEGSRVTLEPSFIEAVVSKKLIERVVNIVEFSRRAISSYVAQGRAGRISLDMLTTELSSKLVKQYQAILPRRDYEDPREHLFLRTSSGLTKLNERSSIREFASKLKPGSKIFATPLGGVLNEVYLVTIGEDKFVVKHFTDWHSFKWFTLNMVALGARKFAVSGKARLENEYGMNQVLSEKGIPTFSIVGVSIPDRMLIESYIEGESLQEPVKRLVRKNGLSQDERKLAESIGEAIGRVHREGIALGDCKPENFIFSKGAIHVVDLEQAGLRGDMAWDVAEFLYFVGHHLSTLTGGLTEFLKAFTSGYSKASQPSILRKASSINYAKTFSIWTLPSVIYATSKALREAG